MEEKKFRDYFPELVDQSEDDQPWKVLYTDTEHKIDLDNKIVVVPSASHFLDDEGIIASAEEIRLFNLLRAKHSPKENLDTANPLNMFKLSLEEVRISEIARSIGLSLDHRYDTVINKIDVGSMQRVDLAASYVLMSSMVKNNKKAMELLWEIWEKLSPNESEQEWLKRSVADIQGKATTSKDNGIKYRNAWAERLTELFSKKQKSGLEQLTGSQNISDKELKQLAKKSDEIQEEIKDTLNPSPDSNMDGINIPGGWGSPYVIGNMMVHEHIARNTKSNQLRLPKGAKSTGIIPDLWHRFCEDQSIFRSRRKGGSIVIDCSGSMSWDWDYLRNAIKNLPASTVGLYAGMNDIRNNEETVGFLCVIASEGRWSPPDYDGNGGNNVDYEALFWLSQQPKPRIWVSDGQVCGGQYWKNDTDGHLLLPRMCNSIMKKSKILRVRTLEEAISYSRTGRVPSKAFTTCGNK